METKSLVQTAVAVLVAVVVFATVLIPITTSATDHTVEFHNVPVSERYMISDKEPVTIDFVDGAYSINGVTTIPLSSDYASISSDGFIMRNVPGGFAMVYLDSETQSWQSIPGNAHIEVANGHGTVTTSDSVHYFDYTYFYYQNEQDYTMMVGGEDFYLTSDTTVVCSGYNSVLGGAGVGRFFIMNGSIEDGFTLTSILGVTTTFKQINYEKVNGYEDLYKVTSIVFETSGGDEIIVDRCIVPETVIATAEHNPAVDTLVGIIPLLVIVGLILSVIGIAIARRYDL